MAHISGLVAAQVSNNPFELCDVVCTTTCVPHGRPLSELALTTVSAQSQDPPWSPCRSHLLPQGQGERHGEAYQRRRLPGLPGWTPQQREFLNKLQAEGLQKQWERTIDAFLPRPQTIAGIAVALKQAASPAFREYAAQVVKNARTIAEELLKHDYKLQTEGSDNHLVLWDLRPLGLTGSKIEKVRHFF